MNTIILKILCWINGIKNPFTWAKEHEKRDYKSIEHVMDNARFFMESTHELAYDHGYSDGQIEVLDKIRTEIKDNRDEWIKGQDAEWHTYDRCLQIIDKYRKEQE